VVLLRREQPRVVSWSEDRDGEIDDIHAKEHDRHLERQSPRSLRGAERERGGDDEAEGADHQHRGANIEPTPVDPLLAVPQAPGEERHAKADQQIGEDGAGERGLDDAGEAVGKRHHPDDQFREVVEGRVDEPPGHRPLSGGEVLGGVTNQPHQRHDRRQGRDGDGDRRRLKPGQAKSQRNGRQEPPCCHLLLPTRPHRDAGVSRIGPAGS
jgi:hypothetical protein